MLPEDDRDQSLGEGVTAAGSKGRPSREFSSLGEERTAGGNSAVNIDTIHQDFEVVELESRYTIKEPLGQGGMGAVLLATDTRLSRKVAIKRILGEAARSKTAIMRFLTEAKAIAALNHPNIVQIYDYGRAKDGPFLIMEFVDGGSLADRCKQGAIPLEEAVELACQICDGLAKAHDAGIVHRDIKPANVLLNRDGLPKLTDFGLAKAEAADHGMTMTGAVMGTPDFMPPEQIRGAEEVDHRSDLWSLAATIYQMVTGRSPRFLRFNEIPVALQGVLGKALEDRKDSRYQSAREFRDALKTVRGAAGRGGGSATASDTIEEGRCPACGTHNPDLNRKFCRNPQCGASLRMACLQCDAPMPVWEAICGECGSNQPKKLVEKRATLEATRAAAEERLSEYAFDAAAALADELAAIKLPQLTDLADWGRSFAERIAQERTRQEEFAAEKLREAQAHRKAFDYPASIAALEAIPQRLRTTAAAELLATFRKEHDESTRLIDTIAARIGRKEIDGLLPLVERAIALRSDRQDLAKIRGQLSERLDRRLAQARTALAAGDAAAAGKALGGAAIEDLGDEAALFHRVTRAAAAEERLLRLVKEAKADGAVSADEARRILAAGEECLALNPASEKIKTLVGQARGIVDREARRLLAMPPLRNSIGMELKLLPAGTFMMGQADDDSDETPHQVTLTQPFYIGVHEVTNAQWKRVMGSVPSKWKDADRPVERVKWEEAREFCRKLSALPEERQAGRVYRLPTEAEWEYACRAGTETKYSFGDDESQLGDYAWFGNNSGHEALDSSLWDAEEDNSLLRRAEELQCQTHPVARKKPNAWDLFDMHGNLFEWCKDWYAEYASDAVTDPQGPSDGSRRVVRGGCWGDAARFCGSAFRYACDPSYSNYNLGFRLALSQPEVQPVPPEAESEARVGSVLSPVSSLRNEVGHAPHAAEDDDVAEADPLSGLTNAPTDAPIHNDANYSDTSDLTDIVDLDARYRIEGTLGQGGMGTVLLATDTLLGRKVAIKRILGEAAQSKPAIARFLTEAKAIAALAHPNIVQIYDYGVAKDGPFLIMEFVDGGSLLDKCHGTAIPMATAIELACQLCDGLATAHERGLIHRDIKPANVLLTENGIPKLIDFGLVKAEHLSHAQDLTGMILGTPGFMPPEQRRNASEVDTRSDLWSLAATVYQMVTGRSPKALQLFLLPIDLRRVLTRALDDSKENRFQSAGDFRNALKAVVN